MDVCVKSRIIGSKISEVFPEYSTVKHALAGMPALGVCCIQDLKALTIGCGVRLLCWLLGKSPQGWLVCYLLPSLKARFAGLQAEGL